MRSILALLLLTVSAAAQTATTPAPIALVCAYNSAVPSPADGQFFYVQCDSTGKIITSGSGGTPGGTNGQLQFNNAGAFGGTATGTGVLTAIGNAVDGTGGLLTYSSIGTSGAKLPLLNAANTWGATQTLGSNALILNGTNIVADAANSVTIRNGANVQTLNLYGTYTDASNYERLAFSFGANQFKISTESAGTGGNRYLMLKADSNIILNGGNGGGRSIQFQVGGVGTWYMTGVGHFIAETDNTLDFGASGANRPRNAYLAGKIVTGSTTLHETSVALTNGAAFGTGTLTNAPIAGDPTKWFPINDNGTTRYVPSW